MSYIIDLKIRFLPYNKDMDRINRPWGSFETLFTYHAISPLERSVAQDELNVSQVKRISVKPQQKLSLQFHNHRAEHWVVIQGEIVAQVGDDFHVLHRNQSIYIPTHVKHRIINNSNTVAELIEVQIGSSVDEDDIVRLEDDYGRI